MKYESSDFNHHYDTFANNFLCNELIPLKDNLNYRFNGKNIFKDSIVVDLGSGRPSNFNKYRKAMLGLGASKVIGVEIFNTVWEPLLAKRIGMVESDMLSYLGSLESNSIDVITIFGIDWCIINPNTYMPKVAKQINRVLVPRGYVFGSGTWFNKCGGLEFYNMNDMIELTKTRCDLSFNAYQKKDKPKRKKDNTMAKKKDKNLCGKTRDVNKPYEVWEGYHPLVGDIEYRVLKKYQKPSLEKSNPDARWFVAAKSEATFGSWEYADTYIKDITSFCTKVEPSVV